MTTQDDAVPSMGFARPSDPPQTFREDWRGKAPRTDEDYAALAVSYLAAGGSRRIASEWSERFGRSAQRWRMDIAVAKRFIQKAQDGTLMLTEEGQRLAYGGPVAQHELDEIAVAEWLDVMERGADEVRRAAVTVATGRWSRKKGMTAREGLAHLIAQQRDTLAAAEAFLYSSDLGENDPASDPSRSQTKPKESWEQE